jgi:N-acetylglutamate synthase
MDIRIMKITDYENAYRLWTNTVGMGMRTIDDSFEGITRFLQRNPNTSFVAEIGKNIVGIILCGHDGRRGYIYHTAVSSDYRKQGIGKTLVETALDALKKEQINKVALVVYHTNDLGNEFWESIGFMKRDDLVYRNKSINEENI